MTFKCVFGRDGGGGGRASAAVFLDALTIKYNYLCTCLRNVMYQNIVRVF